MDGPTLLHAAEEEEDIGVVDEAAGIAEEVGAMIDPVVVILAHVPGLVGDALALDPDPGNGILLELGTVIVTVIVSHALSPSPSHLLEASHPRPDPGTSFSVSVCFLG